MNWLANLLKALLRGLGDLSPSCKAAVRLQSQALDGPLSFRQRLGLRIHLVLCKWCRRYGQHIGFLRSAAQKSPTVEPHLPPEPLSPAARERIKRRLQTEGK